MLFLEFNILVSRVKDRGRDGHCFLVLSRALKHLNINPGSMEQATRLSAPEEFYCTMYCTIAQAASSKQDSSVVRHVLSTISVQVAKTVLSLLSCPGVIDDI